MSDASPIASTPLAYAGAGLYRPPRGLKRIAVLSFIVSMLTVGGNAFLTVGGCDEAVESKFVTEPAAQWSPPAGPLTAHQIELIRGQLDPQYYTVTSEARDAIGEYFSSPQQALFYPTPDDEELRWQIHSIANGPDNFVEIQSDRGKLHITKYGRTTVTMSNQQPYAAKGFVHHIKWPALCVAIGEGTSLLLALFLVWAGIQAWRKPVGGIQLLRRYAIFQAPIAIATIAAIVVADWNDWMGGVITVILSLPSIIALVYAIVLLIYLFQPRVRAYAAGLDQRDSPSIL